MNMEKYEENDDSIWRVPSPGEHEVVNMWCGYAWQDKKLVLFWSGLLTLALSIIFIVSGIYTAGQPVREHEVNLTGIGVLIILVGGFLEAVCYRRFSRSRKNIQERDYLVTYARAVDKKTVIGRYGSARKYVTVQSGDRRDEIRIYDPLKDNMYEDIGMGTEMILIRYPDNHYGFCDKIDLIYPEPFYVMIRLKKETGSDE